MSEEKKLPGRPFVKGDPRIWRQGRPKNEFRPLITLEQAMEMVGRQKRLSLLVHIVRRAYTSDLVAIAVLKKILPDKILTEGEKQNNLIYIINKYLGKGTNPGPGKENPSALPSESDRVLEGDTGDKPLEG